MSSEDIKNILSEVKLTNRLLILFLTKDMKQNDSIAFLSSAKLQPKDIADFLGTTPNTVRVALSEMRKKKGSSQDKK